MTGLAVLVEAELTEPVLPEVKAAADALARRLGGAAVLFYGSVLRTGDLDGVLDFYVLWDDARPQGPIGRLLWPDVSYHELPIAGRTIRAKVATMSVTTFHKAATGVLLDTTIWARFVQPARLVHAATPEVRARTVAAVAAAVATATRFAALHGPRTGAPIDYWRCLFRATYQTELRVEPSGRSDQIVAHAPDRYVRLLAPGWMAAGIGCRDDGDGRVAPQFDDASAIALAEAWLLRERIGRWLNAARLVKAAFTFDGAARYALWKVERHTGLRIALTPWRERHPILSAPGVLARIWFRKLAR